MGRVWVYSSNIPIGRGSWGTLSCCINAVCLACCKYFSKPSFELLLHSFLRQQDQVLQIATMTDNYIVKTVAGTCVGFSFILVGKAIQLAVYVSSLT
jgi:hypothetical protein